MKLSKEDVILRYLQNKHDIWWIVYNSEVEKSDEMRELICSIGCPGAAYEYAIVIDCEPHELTRKASSRDIFYRGLYERWEKRC